MGVIVVETRTKESPGWIYFWKCTACNTEIRKSEYGQQTFLECYCCAAKIYRASVTKDEWETK